MCIRDSFETLTLAPFDRDALDPALLTASERDWLNGYHRRVYAPVSYTHLDVYKRQGPAGGQLAALLTIQKRLVNGNKDREK